MTTDVSVPRKIDLNQADVETLAQLSGIGAALAARIVQYREEVQPFEEAIEVVAVSGISEEMYRQFADRVTVSAVDAGDVEAAAETLLETETGDSGPEPEAWDDDQGVEASEDTTGEGETAEVALEPAEVVAETAETGAEEAEEEEEEEEEGYIILDDEEEAEEARSETGPVLTDNGQTDDGFKAASEVGSFRRSWLLMVVASLLGAFIALAAMYALNQGSLVTATHPKIVAFEANIANLEEREAALKDKTVELENKLNEYDSLSTRLKKAEAEVEILKQARDTLNEEVDALGGRANTLETQTAALETQASALKKQLDALEQDARQMEKSISQLQQAAGRFDTFLTGLSELLLTVQNPAAAASTPAVVKTPTAQSKGTAAPDVAKTPTKKSTPKPTETPVKKSSGTPTAKPSKTPTKAPTAGS